MSRLFAFGCSFTLYHWPTWADILAYDLGHIQNKSFYNFGLLGIGNQAIAQRILEADLKFNFKHDDKIIILWSSWVRHDRIKHGNYNDLGNIFLNKVYDKNYIEKWFDPLDTIVQNCSNIIYVNKLYKSLILWQGSASSVETISSIKAMGTSKDEIQKIWDLYFPHIKNLSFKDLGGELAFGNVQDVHPDIGGYIDLLENWICPSFKYKLKLSTVTKWRKIHKDITNLNNNNQDPNKLFKTLGVYMQTQHKDYYQSINRL